MPSTRVGYRANPTEEEILLKLSERLDHETLSDTLRYAVRFTARAYGLMPEKQHPILLTEIDAQDQQKLVEPATHNA